MPLVVIFEEDFKSEDEAAILSEYQLFLELNPHVGNISFEEWLVEYKNRI